MSSMFRVAHDTKHADLPEILALIRTKNTTGGLSPIGTQCEPMGLNAMYGGESGLMEHHRP